MASRQVAPLEQRRRLLDPIDEFWSLLQLSTAQGPQYNASTNTNEASDHQVSNSGPRSSNIGNHTSSRAGTRTRATRQNERTFINYLAGDFQSRDSSTRTGSALVPRREDSGDENSEEEWSGDEGSEEDLSDEDEADEEASEEDEFGEEASEEGESGEDESEDYESGEDESEEYESEEEHTSPPHNHRDPPTASAGRGGRSQSHNTLDWLYGVAQRAREVQGRGGQQGRGGRGRASLSLRNPPRPITGGQGRQSSRPRNARVPPSPGMARRGGRIGPSRAAQGEAGVSGGGVAPARHEPQEWQEWNEWDIDPVPPYPAVHLGEAPPPYEP